MYKFKRQMRQDGVVYRPGYPVPEGFSSPEGLAEMLAVGDIELDEMPEPEAEPEAEPEKPKRKKAAQ